MSLKTDNPFVHYTSAIVTGKVYFSGYGINDNYSSYEKHLSVKIQWGTDKNNLSKSTIASIEYSSSQYDNHAFTYKTEISDLVDGEVYYYVATAQYGSNEEIANPVKFFTLPRGPVNLDLKSGTLWASANLGAAYPEECGDYFSWAETSPKKTNALYDWTYYKWCQGAYNKLTKYCNDSSYGYKGFIDNLLVLQEEDDAAALSLGSPWRIPSDSDWEDLNKQCGWTYDYYNGMPGWFVRSKTNPDDNKKVIFLPLAGYCDTESRRSFGFDGYYWTTNLVGGWYPERAYSFGISSLSHGTSQGSRCLGLNIRPVKNTK